MNRLTPGQHLQFVHIHLVNHDSVGAMSIQICYSGITMNRFRTTPTLVDTTLPQRHHTVHTEEVIITVERSVEEAAIIVPKHYYSRQEEKYC